MTTDAPNTPSKKAERTRGFREGFQQFERLRAKWPKAFPLKSYEIRPLTNSAQQAIVEEFGWSPGYAHGVLAAWKMRPAYCQATLCYSKRINLDGSVSDEEIDDRSRGMAKEQLEAHAARKAAKAERAEQDRLRAAAEAKAEPKAPAPAPEPAPIVIAETKPEPAAPPEPPTALPKPGKLLVAGSAAMQAALKRRLASGSITTEVLKTVPVATPGGRREQRAR